MKYLTQHTGELKIIKNLPNSKNGNPRYLISVDGWICRTAVDSSLAYAIPNLHCKQVIATIGLHYNRNTLKSVSVLRT